MLRQQHQDVQQHQPLRQQLQRQQHRQVVLACERIETAAPAALPASGQDMCHSGQLTQEEHRQRREQALDKAAPNVSAPE